MFRFFVFINLILIHVFCQTTEDNLQFDTDFPTTQSWDQMITEESLELSTNIDKSQLQEEITTEEPLEKNTEDDTTEETSKQEDFTTAQQITSTVPTTCPPSITLDMLEKIKKEIIDAVLQTISSDINSTLEALEARLCTLDCLNNNISSTIKLDWQIYENLQIPLTGWLSVFDQPYSHKTRIDDLNQIAGICHNEVLVGATSVLTINTMWNTPQQFGQVYWYRTKGQSFGFSPNAYIRQTSADNEDLNSSVRLSWLLDQNMGGYRAGVARLLGDSSLWHKVIYCN
jgi:hypothetical protein